MQTTRSIASGCSGASCRTTAPRSPQLHRALVLNGQTAALPCAHCPILSEAELIVILKVPVSASAARFRDDRQQRREKNNGGIKICAVSGLLLSRGTSGHFRPCCGR